MDQYPTDVSRLVQHHGGPLVCHGCAHSSGSAPYPGSPSGERPCCFCTRNVQREEWVKNGRERGATHFNEGEYGVRWTAYYNNSPMKKCPMDCYISTDRIMQTVPEGAHAIT